MTRPLNEQERDLVRQHIRLVWWVVRKKRESWAVRRVGIEDSISCGMVGLARAAKKWKTGAGSFPTFALRLIYFAILNEANRGISKPHKTLMDRETATELRDVIDGIHQCHPTDEGAHVRAMEGRIFCHQLMERLRCRRPRLYRVAKLWAFGRRLRQIAKTMGVTGARAGQLLQKAINSLRKYLQPSQQATRLDRERHTLALAADLPCQIHSIATVGEDQLLHCDPVPLVANTRRRCIGCHRPFSPASPLHVICGTRCARRKLRQQQVI